MTAKVAPTWAAIRAIYEGRRPIFSILSTATRLSEKSIRARAEREGWVDAYGAPTGAGRKLRLQARIERLETLIDTLIGDGDEDGPAIDKARIDMLGVLFRAIDKLKDMMPAPQVEAQMNIRERDEHVARIIQRIDQQILTFAKQFAAKLGSPQLG